MVEFGAIKIELFVSLYLVIFTLYLACLKFSTILSESSPIFLVNLYRKGHMITYLAHIIYEVIR